MLTVDTITLHDLAKLFMIYIFSKYGVLSYITSDHGTEFVSNFFRYLKMILNIKLHFTFGYHPKEDSQTEHTNQMLEWYLHIYCNYQQDNWLDLLLFTEFAYNNAPSATTGMLLFFADKEYHPNITIYPERNIASFCACEFTVDLDKLQDTLKTEISTTQQ